MKQIPLYKFYKHKYGAELLVDVITIDYMRPGIRRTPTHRYTFYSIILVTGGSEELTLNGHCRLMRQGDIACSRPGEVWCWQPDSKLEGLALIFEEPFLLSFFNDSRFLDRFSYLQPERTSPFLATTVELWERLHHLLLLMKEEIDNPTSKDQHILRAMLYETLMLLNRADSADGENILDSPPAGDRYTDRFVRLVDEEYVGHHDVAYYADRLCITPNYLNKMVRPQLGCTAKQYIRQRLLVEARRLLAYTTLSVTEIAEQLQFDSATYFIRTFGKGEGCTPMQYRERMMNRPQK